MNEFNVVYQQIIAMYNGGCQVCCNCSTTRVLSPFRDGGIAYLNDPDSYAGWSFYTPVRASQARQIEG